MSARPVRIVYFAWVRERLGFSEETVELPAEVRTAGDVVRWLAGRDEGHAHALEAAASIRVAADQMLIGPDEAIGGAREIALFPPMTGG